jgi:hypothetical protein
MKNIYLLFVLIILFPNLLFSQYGNITSSIGDYFVQGVSPVNNTITANDASSTYIDFYVLDDLGNTIDSQIDNSGLGGNQSLTYDMGLLAPNYYILVEFFDGNGSLLGDNIYQPTLISTPNWLSNGNGYVDNVNVLNNSVTMIGHFQFNQQNNPMPNDIPGLNGRPYNLLSPEITSEIVFDCSNGQSTVSNLNADISLNIFNQATIPYSYPLNGNFSLDQNFDPTISLSGSLTSSPFEINWPLGKFYPLLPSPTPSIKIDGGLKINAELNGNMNYNFNNAYNSWGVDSSLLTAKINAKATLRVKADALIASATGSLLAEGSIGVGVHYTDFPTPSTNSLFGGDLMISGAIDYKLGPKFFTVSEGHLEKTFYDKSWGDQIKGGPFTESIWDEVDAYGNSVKLFESNPYLITPDLFAQPNISANDSSLYVVWLDTSDVNTNILFSKLDYNTNTFSLPEIVWSEEVISNPKVSILPSGNALISWTQNRYNSNNFDTTTMDLQDLLEAQDIWITMYENQNNTFTQPIMLNDDNSNLQSGRAEGNANIIMGKGPYGLITWVVRNDESNTNADVYYCSITEDMNGVTLGVPTPLLAPSSFGTDRSINISYYDSTHAIATWIHDPDGFDSTLNNVVQFMQWTQVTPSTGTWGAPETIINNNGFVSFDEVSLDFNGIYGAIAWTTTEYDQNGDFEKGLYASAWNPNTLDWATTASVIDPYFSFQQPKVSVNKNGFVALTYQSMELFNDTINPDLGQLNLYMNDSQMDPAHWEPSNNGTGILGDSSVYIWDMTTSYGNEDNFYIITQESDTITGNAPINPPNGDRFGNLYLNLVVRALNVSGFSVSDIPEPTSISTQNKEDHFNFKLYPNPTIDFTTIEYVLENPSDIQIDVYDLFGNQVAYVFNQNLGAGAYKLLFKPDGLDNGVYVCKIMVNEKSYTKRLVIAK